MSTRGTGFTLVELLVTVSLVTLVAGACVATFAGGFNVWQRLQAVETQGAWVPVAFEQLRRDLHTVRRFTPIPFEGSYDRFSFAAVIPVTVKTAEGVEETEELGQRGYFFDRARRMLCRSQLPYRRLRHARLRQTCSPVLIGVDRLRVSYYASDPNTGTGGWRQTWSSPELPFAVKIEVDLLERVTRRRETQTLLVAVPIAFPRSPEG